MRTLHKYILDASISAISNQNANGSFSPGVNGPYNDKETPVRNTAHWLFLLLKSYEITGDIKFKNSSVKALEYLMTAECRPGGYAMFCRDVKNKDQCNGLIGQAWAIESILKGGLILDRQDAVTFAIDIFNSHYFDESRSIWHRLSLDGQIMTPDPTFNHQLWFAAIGSFLPNKESNRRAFCFFENIASCPKLYSDGIIQHNSQMGYFSKNLKLSNNKFRFIYSSIKRFIDSRVLYKKSVGYHSFNLYAYGILKQSYPRHEFWNSKTWLSMKNATKTIKFVENLNNNCYGWTYNSPGIELAFVNEVDSNHVDAQEWLNMQNSEIIKIMNVDALTGSSDDPATSAARLYEACRLQVNYKINV